MITLDPARLRQVRSLGEVLEYLADDLDWPIDADDLEEAVFDWDPVELGIPADRVPTLSSLRQLRPLQADQPWGVFFLEFDGPRLPLTALRRLLTKLVSKKRASSGSLKTWDMDDLLFIITTGSGESVELHFVAFFDTDAKTPEIRSLPWRPIHSPAQHLRRLSTELLPHLSWPAENESVEGWRDEWRSAFRLRHGAALKSAIVLAQRMASVARELREGVSSRLAAESGTGPFSDVLDDVRSNLVDGIDNDEFADMCAQTLVYGLLSSRVTDPEAFGASPVLTAVPLSNPFLAAFFEQIHDELAATGADDGHLEQLTADLRATPVEAILDQFGAGGAGADPVLHFYETFLREYDAAQRMERGVFYTPQPLVKQVVRHVDRVLRSQFGLVDGLADSTTWGEFATMHPGVSVPAGVEASEPFVRVLDPATGTGTFLVEVIDVVYATMIAKWETQGMSAGDIASAWSEYVVASLLPRLFGFELMMAPYAVAHVKIGLKLHETGFVLGGEDRLNVYLTNALDPPNDLGDHLEGMLPALATEAAEASRVKADPRFTVVIGNPPYSASVSEPPWIMQLLAEWKEGLSETKIDLNREEWKFLRLAQYWAETSGSATVGFVINRDFLDGIVKRQMRSSLIKAFPYRFVVDLNGDVKGEFVAEDENVFDIQQGVCTVILASAPAESSHQYASLLGSREFKYEAMSDEHHSEWAAVGEEFEPAPTLYRWSPFDSEGTSDAGYSNWMPITTIFEVYSSGIQTKRDRLCVQFSSEEVWEVVQDLVHSSEEEVRKRYNLGQDGRDWTVAGAVADVEHSGPSKDLVAEILYRPYDKRATYWTGRTKGFLAYPRREVMQHMVRRSNLGFMFNRQIVGDDISHFGVADCATCHGTYYLGNKGQDYLAPIRLYEDGLLAGDTSNTRSNFSTEFVARLRDSMAGLRAADLEPESLLAYLLAVTSSPTYRRVYRDLIKSDFARIPIPRSDALFRLMVNVGSDLVRLHLLRDIELVPGLCEPVGGLPMAVDSVEYDGKSIWLDTSRARGLRDVPLAAWEARQGGYQVLEKWIKERRARGGKNPSDGRPLDQGDIAHLQLVVSSLVQQAEIVAGIDQTIAVHGGWPGAFS